MVLLLVGFTWFVLSKFCTSFWLLTFLLICVGTNMNHEDMRREPWTILICFSRSYTLLINRSSWLSWMNGKYLVRGYVILCVKKISRKLRKSLCPLFRDFHYSVETTSSTYKDLSSRVTPKGSVKGLYSGGFLVSIHTSDKRFCWPSTHRKEESEKVMKGRGWGWRVYQWNTEYLYHSQRWTTPNLPRGLEYNDKLTIKWS